jgi:hypothetical protein
LEYQGAGKEGSHSNEAFEEEYLACCSAHCLCLIEPLQPLKLKVAFEEDALIIGVGLAIARV